MQSPDGLPGIRNVQVKLTPEEHKLLTEKAETSGASLQAYVRRLVRADVGLGDLAATRPPDQLGYHNKLNFVFDNGDNDDCVGIQKNLDWAVSDIRARKPTRKHA